MKSARRRPAAPAGVVVVILAIVFFVPRGAGAQAGFYVTPSLAVAEVYDDNLFSTPTGRQTDLISRFTPGVEAGYRSEPFTLLGRYTSDAELYVDHPELNDPQVRQEAEFDLVTRSERVLSLSLTGAFVETQTPGDLNVDTGLVSGRVRARRLSLSPSLGYEFDPLTSMTVDAAVTDDEVEGGASTRAYVGGARLDRRLGRRDTGSAGYTFRRFVFDGDESSESHVLTLGWSREFTPLTSVTLRAGPRYSEGSVDPEVSASIRRRFQRGELALTYGRSESTVIGETGAVTNESFSALASYEPVRRLQVRAAPSVVRTSGDGLEATVYGASLEATYRLTKWLVLDGSYGFTLQRGSLVPGRPADEEIVRTVVLLRLTIAFPYRLR